MTRTHIVPTLALLLSGLVGCSSGQSPRSEVHRFAGTASLPLTGDLAPLGQAFQRGFQEGLALHPDSLYIWDWTWHDNEGSPDSLQAWADRLRDTTAYSLALGGLGSTVTGVVLDSARIPVLWLGDGSSARGPGGVWPLWPTHLQVARVLSAWLATQDSPSVALVLADASWTPPLLDHDSLFRNLTAMPHDPLIRRWDREMGLILASKPKTLVCWNRPEDATSFVTRPLIAPFLSTRALLLPDGVPAPAGGKVSRIRPLWQPALPPDSLQVAFLQDWGRRVGSALASSTRRRLTDSLRSWEPALRLAAPDSARHDAPDGGWLPRLRIVADSVDTVAAGR
jgi:hypothetical protein